MPGWMEFAGLLPNGSHILLAPRSSESFHCHSGHSVNKQASEQGDQSRNG